MGRRHNASQSIILEKKSETVKQHSRSAPTLRLFGRYLYLFWSEEGDKLEEVDKMAPVPRRITGSIGSRIRLVLGSDGDEWLLLLNHDNGDAEWQEKDWKNIPEPLVKQLNNCTIKGRDIKAVDFIGDDWYVRGEKADGTGGHSWWGGELSGSQSFKLAVNLYSAVAVSVGASNFDTTYVIVQGNSNGYVLSPHTHNYELRGRLERAKSINYVRLFNDGQYFISDELGIEWKICYNDALVAELSDNSKGKIEDVAVADNGDSWVVIRHNSFASSSELNEDLRTKLTEFYSEQRRRVAARNREILRHRLAFNAAREAVEREERELFLRRAQEAEEAKYEETDAAFDADAAAAAQLKAVIRISSLEATLERRLIEEANDIKETEEKLRETKDKLLNRKRSFREAILSMPPETQSRINLDYSNTTSSDNICVVCHDGPPVMAVVPCGHVCLCTNCSDVCMTGENEQRPCPLCRGHMQSVLRIYLGN